MEQIINRPAVRNAEFWYLKTSEHGGTLRLPFLSLIVHKGEDLLDWSYQTYAIFIADYDAAAIVNAVDAKGR